MILLCAQCGGEFESSTYRAVARCPHCDPPLGERGRALPGFPLPLGFRGSFYEAALRLAWDYEIGQRGLGANFVPYGGGFRRGTRFRGSLDVGRGLLGLREESPNRRVVSLGEDRVGSAGVTASGNGVQVSLRDGGALVLFDAAGTADRIALLAGEIGRVFTGMPSPARPPPPAKVEPPRPAPPPEPSLPGGVTLRSEGQRVELEWGWLFPRRLAATPDGVEVTRRGSTLLRVDADDVAEIRVDWADGETTIAAVLRNGGRVPLLKFGGSVGAEHLAGLLRKVLRLK